MSPDPTRGGAPAQAPPAPIGPEAHVMVGSAD